MRSQVEEKHGLATGLGGFGGFGGFGVEGLGGFWGVSGVEFKIFGDLGFRFKGAWG